MDKRFIIILFLLSISPFVSAQGAHGPYELNNSITLFLNCNDCTSGTITKVIHPNRTAIIEDVALIQDGTLWSYELNASYVNELGIYEWCFSITDGTETVTGCIPEEVTRTGEDIGTFRLVLNIFMIILIVFGLVVAVKHFGSKDFEALSSKIVEKHEGANYFKTFGRTFVYGLMKNSFLWFYIAGWLLLFFINEIMLGFGSIELYNYFALILDLYSIGFIIVIVFFVGILFKHFDYIKDIIDDINLGVDK